MGNVAGLGGVFLKTADPQALADWYQEKLGINFNGKSYVDLPFKELDGRASTGSNVLSFFAMDSKYYAPSESKVMLNLRVNGLKEFLEEIREKGVIIVGDMMDEEYGKFAWILDLDGNKIELWEPPKG